MAATPKRARGAENALAGAMLRDSRAWARAFAALREDFAPIDDHRASSRYRTETAHALLGKALIEAAGTGSGRTRVVGHAGESGLMDLADILSKEPPLAVVRKPIAHDSAVKHVTGSALYIDDILEPAGTLHLAPGYAPIAAGRVTKLDLEAVIKAPGVVAVLTAADIPGSNDVSPKGVNDDPVITPERIMFYGQVLFAVVAQTRDQARRAARLAKIATAPSMPVIDVDDALVAATMVLPDYAFGHGDPLEEIDQAPRQVTGEFRIGGQEHFYLEGQVALADARRGRRHARLFVDPASDRGPARRRPHARPPRQCRHRARCAAWAAASAARRARRRNGRRSPHSAPTRPAGRARCASTATTT